MKKIIIITSFLLCSIAVADNSIPAGQEVEAKIGFGYDTDEQRITGSRCLKGVEERHGQQKANISFDQTVDQSQMSNEFGFDAGSKFRYGAAKIGVSAKFLKSVQKSAFSIVAVYSGDYTFKNILLDFEDSDDDATIEEIEQKRLSNTGKLAKKQDTRWRETCGHEYIQQITRGAKLFYSIRIDFSTQEEKDLFEAAFSYDSSYASVHAHLKNQKNNFSKNTKVKIGALQIGGNVRKITELFNGENDSDGSMGFVKCSFGDFSKCDAVMAQAWEYATKEFKKQLEDDPDKPNAEGGPAYIRYLTKDYTAAGIYPNNPSILTDAILMQRENLEKEFDRQFEDAGQVDHLLKSELVILSPRQNKVLSEAAKKISDNIDRLIKAAIICYEDESTKCIDEANKVLIGENKIQPLDQEILIIEPETFRQFCSLSDTVLASSSLRKSIKGMIEAAKEMEPNAFSADDEGATDPCLISHMVFSRNSNFDKFNNKGIVLLDPIEEYTHVNFINLAENEIEDLKPLKNWRNLEYIDLHGNKIREIEVLTELRSLREIKISNNRIRNIDRLAVLPDLQRLDARNNFPSVTCEKVKETALNENLVCLSATVKTDVSFVSIQTPSANPLFIPGVALVEPGVALITGYGKRAELYSSQNNSFDVTDSMGADVAYGQVLTSMENGKILVSGGWNSPNRILEFEIETGLMRQAFDNLKVKRADHRATLLKDGRVLITGGWETGYAWSGTDASFTAEIYDPVTRTTSLLPKMHAPRAWHTATLLDSGKVLIVGGYSPNGSLATAELFDPTTNKFELVGKSMSEGRGAHTATLLDDGNVLIVGGFNEKEEASKTAEIFVTQTNSFKKISESLYKMRGFHSAIKLKNGKVLLSGGSNDILTPDAPLSGSALLNKTGEIFDPLENSFSLIPTTMHLPRSRHQMLELKPGLVLVVGSIAYDGAVNSEVFTYTDTEVESIDLSN